MDKDIQTIKNISIDLRRNEYHFLPDKSVIVVQLDALNNALSKLKANAKKKLMENDKYYQALSSVRFDIQTTIKCKETDSVFKLQLIKLRDQIFGSKLKGMFDDDDANKHQRKASIVFIKFIEGITYFANEKTYNIRDMIYHRNGSCSKNGKENFDCRSFSNRAHRKSNSHLIEKCYIERLIYDHLWLHIQQVPQDISHVEWLEKTRQAYASCFPTSHVSIKIGQYKTMPEKLTIERYIDNILVDIETYTKKWNAYTGSYDELVICKKHKPIIKSAYTKNQTFIGREAWINLNPKKRNSHT